MNYMDDTLGCSTTKDIGFAVTTGTYPGFSTIDKFGLKPDVTTGSSAEIDETYFSSSFLSAIGQPV